jgi:transcriptional regulator with XRE-family HTH domain
MTRWGSVLKKARTRAGLTQEDLAAKVHHISVSYLRKMETGLLGPPRREKAEMLADALNITDPEKRNAFFRAAEVGNDEDMEGFRLVKVEDDKAVKSKQQAGSTPLPTMANPAVEVGDTLLGTTGQHIDRLIASGDLSPEEEDEVAAALIEMTKRFLAFKEAKQQMK